MKLTELQDRICAKYENFDDLTDHVSVPDVIREIVKDVVEGVGFHINNAGEICDPRPTPGPNRGHYSQNVHYNGQPRRRRPGR